MAKERRGEFKQDSHGEPDNATLEDAMIWRGFLRGVPHPMMVIDQNHCVVSANQAALRALARTPEEMIGSKCYELFHGSDHPAAGCPMERLLSEGFEGIVEIEAQTTDRTLMVSCVPIYSETGGIAHAVHIAVDVADLKRTQLALRESEERYRSHFENISDVVFSLDHASHVVDVSPSAEKVSGYKREELIGKAFVDLGILVPESQALATANIERVLKGESNVTAEYGYITKDGRKGIAEINASPSFSKDGDVTGISAVARDITERKAAEEALQESESTFRNLSERSVAGIYVIQDGVFKYVNLKLAQVFGYTIDEMIDRMGPEDIIFTPDWPIVKDNLQKRLSGEIDSLHYEFRIITSSHPET
jgi:PAS domain S-box-containing protein